MTEKTLEVRVKTRDEYVESWRAHYAATAWVGIDAGDEDRWLELRDGFDAMIERAAVTLYGERK